MNRRQLLRSLGVLSVPLAGCLDETGTAPPADVTDAPKKTPSDLPEWEPTWTMELGDRHVLGLDTADGLLYTALSAEDGPSAVAAIDPTEQSVLWQTESEGEAVGGSHAAFQHIARGQWGVTLTDERVYAVAGRAEEREWSALHALDRDTGERRWSLQRRRELAVVGVVDGLVVAAGLEFFPPPGQTPVSHQTPESPLTTVVYGIDADDGSVRWTREFVDVRDVAAGPEGVFVAAGKRLVGLDREGTDRFTDEKGPAHSVAVAPERVFYLTGKRSETTLHGVSLAGERDWRCSLAVEELLVDGDRLYAGGDVVAAVETDGSVAWRDDDHGQWLLLDPVGDTLYTRSGRNADAATAYDVAGSERWTFTPPSNNAWPEAATADALLATAITAESGDEPFYTLYAVTAEGEATASLGKDTVFDALGLDGTFYVADGVSNLVALAP